MTDRVAIRQPDGRSGTRPDPGRGPAEFSFNLIAARQARKTTLAQQMMFAFRSRSPWPRTSPSSANLPQDAALSAAVQLLRYGPRERVGPLRQSEPGRVGGRRDAPGTHRSGSRSGEPGVVVVDSFRTPRLPGHRPATLICSISCSDWPSGSQAGRRRRFSSASINPRRLNRIRSSPSRTDCYGSIKRRSEFDGSQDANHEDAWTGTDSRAAHLPHHERRYSGVPPGHRRPRGEVATGRDSREGQIPPEQRL